MPWRALRGCAALMVTWKPVRRLPCFPFSFPYPSPPLRLQPHRSLRASSSVVVVSRRRLVAYTCLPLLPVRFSVFPPDLFQRQGKAPRPASAREERQALLDNSLVPQPMFP